MNESQYRVAKVVIAVLLLIVLYLFALNGRYYLARGITFDKWNKEYIENTKLLKK